MLRLAFYKGPATFYDRVIRLWTWGPYSHCELIIDDVAFSAIAGVGTRYLLYPTFKSADWDYLDIPLAKADTTYVWNWCMNEMNCGYDWKGIFFAQGIPLKSQDPHKWFCSEFCTAALRIGGVEKQLVPHRMSPNSLHRHMRKVVKKVAAA